MPFLVPDAFSLHSQLCQSEYLASLNRICKRDCIYANTWLVRSLPFLTPCLVKKSVLSSPQKLTCRWIRGQGSTPILCKYLSKNGHLMLFFSSARHQTLKTETNESGGFKSRLTNLFSLSPSLCLPHCSYTIQPLTQKYNDSFVSLRNRMKYSKGRRTNSISTHLWQLPLFWKEFCYRKMTAEVQL